MATIASQITSLTIVYSIVYSDADQRKHQSSASLALCGEFTGDILMDMLGLKLIHVSKRGPWIKFRTAWVNIWWRHHVTLTHQQPWLTLSKCPEGMPVAPGSWSLWGVGFHLEHVFLVHLQTFHEQLRVRCVDIKGVDGVLYFVVDDFIHDDLTITQCLSRLVPGQLDAGWAHAYSREVLRGTTRYCK